MQQIQPGSKVTRHGNLGWRGTVLHIDAATQTAEVWLDWGEKRTVCLEDLTLAP